MAIVLEQAPYNFSGFRHRNNLVICTSTNITEDGFKYKVTVEAGGVTLYTGYIAPNPANALVFDLYPIISQIGSMVESSSGNNLWKYAGASTVLVEEKYPGTSFTYTDRPVTVTVDEAWLVGGVLTDNPDIHAAEVISKIMFNRANQFSEGYRQQPALYAQLDGNTDKFLTDRTWETQKWDMSQSVGLGAPDNTKIYYRALGSDYGVLSLAYTSADNRSINNLPAYAATKIRISLLPATGSPIDYTESLTALDDGIVHVACFPANLKASTIAGLASIQAQLNAGTWYAIYVRALSTADAQVSATHIIYNTALFGASDCRFDNVRLTWLNSQGGWDVFNFIKRSEKQYSIDRKQYKRIAGNYATANGDSVPFALNQYERGVTQTQATVERYLEITSDWLTEGEFAFMTSLITSPDVYLLDTLGNATAVVVDRNDYTEKKERTGKKYNVTMRIRYAHDLNT
jgi:hypothetical protein